MSHRLDLADYGDMRHAAALAIGLFPRVEIDPEHAVELIDALAEEQARGDSLAVDLAQAVARADRNYLRIDLLERIVREARLYGNVPADPDCVNCRGTGREASEYDAEGRPVMVRCGCTLPGA